MAPEVARCQTPPLPRGFANGNVNNSADSPLSNMPAIMDFQDHSPMPNSPIPNSQATLQSESEVEKDLLKHDIITVILNLDMPAKLVRHKHMRDCFDKQGRVYKIYQDMYKDDINKAQEQRKEASKSQKLLGVRGKVASLKPDRVSGKPDQHQQQTAAPTVQIVLGKENTISSPPFREERAEEDGGMDLFAGFDTQQKKSKTRSNANPVMHSEEDIQNSESDEHRGPVTQEAAHSRDPEAGRQSQTLNPNPSTPATNDTDATQYSSAYRKIKAAANTVAASSDWSGDTIVSDGQGRERRLAARSLRQTLQRQLEHAPTSCRSCSPHVCSCQSEARAQDILCNGDGCSKSWFSNEYLEKNLGISLDDALNSRLKYGFWLCPECSYKKRTQDSRGPDVFRPTGILPRYGSEFLEPEDVSKSLNEFWGLTKQYTHMASKDTAPPMNQPFLRIPCIREESPDERYSPLIYVLRRILKIEQGILVKDMVLNSQMQDLECSAWMRAVLVYLFFEFVFNSPSPFDDAGVWHQSLLHCFGSQELAEMLVQDNRIRTMHENTGSYQARCKESRGQHIRQLNAAMMPLIGGSGGNEALYRMHERIADIAGTLRSKFSAYTGNFEKIMPEFWEQFDAEIHESDDPMDEYKDLSNRHIMLTTMVGVTFKTTGQPLQIWSKAKVRLWPKLASSPGKADMSESSTFKCSGERRGSKKRSYHDLISPETK